METYISHILIFLYIPIGIYIAHRVCPTTSFLLRFVFLCPAMAAIATIVMVNEHNAQILDIIREISSLLIYAILAYLLTGKRILKNIDSSEPCKRKII